MKILNFGSLNVDLVYPVEHIVRPGETLSAPSLTRHPGGKGLNQSIAAARAGARVVHVGNIGSDGAFLRELLQDAGADVSEVRELSLPSGHAVIQVEPEGQNSILVCPGANGGFTPERIDAALSQAEKGDLVLTQNEISCVPHLLTAAHSRGLGVVLNPSPFREEILLWPLSCVTLFLVNETEGASLTGERDPEAILRVMGEKYPNAETVLTLGEKGSMRIFRGEITRQSAYSVKAVDTTAAGDTWTGYYLARRLAGDSPADAMRCASMASAISVTRPGAAPSIPVLEEVRTALNNAHGHE